MTTYSNPGAIGDVPPTPNKVESTWGNAIRDRIINNFSSAANRDSAITSPVQGQTCYVAYTSSTTGLLTYAGATDGWRPPWNLPWGYVGQASATTTQSSITTITDVTGVQLNFNAVANRVYKSTVTAILSSTVAADQIILTLADNSNNVKQTWTVNAYVANNAIQVVGIAYVTGISAGTATLKARVARSGGTGAVAVSASATNPSIIVVEDVGPNGNPS